MKKNYFLLSLIVVLTFFAPAIKAQSGGCPVIITQPDELIITNITKKTYNGADLSCSNAADGQITVTASGGTTPYQYSKDNGLTFQPSNVFSGLGAGTYKIVVKDNHNCITAPQDIILNAPTPITIISAIKTTYNGSELSCSSSSDGEITVTATGGTGTLEYSKDNGATYQSSNVFSGLSAGTYTIVVRDVNGCTSNPQNVTITAPTPVMVTGAVKTIYHGSDLSCSNATDGQITVTATGGTGTFEYSKDNGATYQSSNVFSGLSAGIYQIVVKDANGCTTAPLQINITAPVALTMSIAKSDVTCFGDNNGWIKVTVSGGSGQYRFSKDGGSNFTLFQAGNEYTFENLVAGTYNIVAEDENGCSATCP